MKNKKINIIYEDNHILVVEKPVNIPSQQDNTKDMDMLTLLKKDLKERYNKPGNVFLGLLHRLDRPVGGVMVFARTSKAASRISDQIRKREFEKTYLAVVHGVPDKLNNTLKHYLLKDKLKNMVSVVSKSTSGAKEAILDYEVIQNNSNLSLVKINLKTGRPHQIRVQFSEIGYPLFGDRKYNKNIDKNEKQIALWSNEIRLVHPTRKNEMTFISFPDSVYPWSTFRIK